MASVRRVGPEAVGRYAAVPSAIEVRSVLRVDALREGRLVEEPVAPWVKDYDRDGVPPGLWPHRFDLSGWALFLAEAPDVVGGAAVAPGDGEAILWDIRVRERGQGIGRALFEAAEAWARGQGFQRMTVETQHVNVGACRFYAAMGCRIAAVDPDAYAGVPAVAHEVAVRWVRTL